MEGASSDKALQPPNTATRRRIILPSLQEVQAAQRPAAAPPRIFQPSGGPSTDSRSQGAAASQTVPGPAQGNTSSATPQPSVRQGLGIFSPEARPSVSRPERVPNVYHQRSAAPTPTTVYGSSGAAAAAPIQQVNPNAILVSKRQEGNPLLKHIRNMRWQHADIVPDYQMGAQHCALFLSLRYHLLKPLYIHGRIKELQRAFRLRILLCHVDVDDAVEPLGQVTRIALLNDCVLICAWSPEECARYLETYKAYETKPADLIQGRTDEDYLSKLNAALTAVRGVNRTDVLTLAGAFRTAAGIMTASMQELAALPGIGPTKVRRLHETLHEPFRKTLRQNQLHFVPTTATVTAKTQESTVASPAGAAGMPAIGDAVMEDDVIEDEDEVLELP